LTIGVEVKEAGLPLDDIAYQAPHLDKIANRQSTIGNHMAV
jgi:hypothetical protein